MAGRRTFRTLPSRLVHLHYSLLRQDNVLNFSEVTCASEALAASTFRAVEGDWTTLKTIGKYILQDAQVASSPIIFDVHRSVHRNIFL